MSLFGGTRKLETGKNIGKFTWEKSMKFIKFRPVNFDQTAGCFRLLPAKRSGSVSWTFCRVLLHVFVFPLSYQNIEWIVLTVNHSHS